MTHKRVQTLDLESRRLSERRRKRSSVENRMSDLEWQIWFVRNHIFGSVERQKDNTQILLDFRDRAIAELNRLKSG
jgi:hypothetical protein